MEIKLKEKDLKTLQEKNGLFSYSIKTKNGIVKCSEIDSLVNTLEHAENNLKLILKSILSK
jgi:hypothetical protein